LYVVAASLAVEVMCVSVAVLVKAPVAAYQYAAALVLAVELYCSVQPIQMLETAALF
jgi:hypothetical protein